MDVYTASGELRVAYSPQEQMGVLTMACQHNRMNHIRLPDWLANSVHAMMILPTACPSTRCTHTNTHARTHARLPRVNEHDQCPTALASLIGARGNGQSLIAPVGTESWRWFRGPNTVQAFELPSVPPCVEAKMREIVHIQAGQCGNQIGSKVGPLLTICCDVPRQWSR